MKKYILPALFAMLATNANAESGCTIIVDQTTGKVIYQKGTECENRYSPESSFKIPIAVMGYDSGVLLDEHEPLWKFKKDYTVNKPDDKQATDPTSWEKNSVVWYSQKITTTIGAEKFGSYIKKFNYGNMDVSGDKGKNNGLTNSWLVSSLKISPLEQIHFLSKLLNKGLGVSDKAYEKTLAIIPEFKAGDWKVFGKTGSGWLPDKNGNADKQHPQGWFIGWAEKGERKIIFTNLGIFDKKSDSPAGPKLRDSFLKQLPDIAE